MKTLADIFEKLGMEYPLPEKYQLDAEQRQLEAWKNRKTDPARKAAKNVGTALGGLAGYLGGRLPENIAEYPTRPRNRVTKALVQAGVGAVVGRIGATAAYDINNTKRP